jgi:hypothetical protein
MGVTSVSLLYMPLRGGRMAAALRVLSGLRVWGSSIQWSGSVWVAGAGRASEVEGKTSEVASALGRLCV